MADINIEKIALLARIKLDPKEKEKLQKEFEDILDYIKSLNSTLNQITIGNLLGRIQFMEYELNEKKLEMLFWFPSVMENLGMNEIKS